MAMPGSRIRTCLRANCGGSAGLADSDMSEGKLRWQCRRGMRELDDLLLAWLNDRYDSADETQKQAFEALLALPDPEIAAYLLKKEIPASRSLGLIVEQILRADSR